MPRLAIQVSSLVKRYNAKNVVDGISFQVPSGECFGLLGPNGAGKTTTMRMLYGSCQVSAGNLQVLDRDIRTEAKLVKSQIGVVPQEDGLDPDFTTLENLIVYCRYHGITGRSAKEKSLRLLEMVGLTEKQGARIPTLSGGMKRRLCIARALLNDPKLLFLDEPTTGLDPQARHWIWSKIREFKRNGVTIVLTTHYMEEAERLCDRLAIMDKGQIYAIGTPQDLIETYVGHEVVEFEYRGEELEYLKQKFEGKYELQILPEKVLLFIKKGQDGKSALNLISSDTMTVRRATLEDVFLKITGQQLRD